MATIVRLEVIIGTVGCGKGKTLKKYQVELIHVMVQ
ncbi:hypothetical protein DFQ12_1465 [Sphingobacterium detergens]|uniref:Uncharacterized protein n=1 Tax=Sphingobacterium detergens TaxID=1145106 RepID=A0A420BIS9_SPHD1|nr:hypothetical protein DFQ12_1465 [Sphingobacterium detergens]